MANRPLPFPEDVKAEAIAAVEGGVPRKLVAARTGCSESTLKDWLSYHRIGLMRDLSDEELLNYPEHLWKMFTPHEQLMWVQTIYERGLNLHDFPLIGTLKRQVFPVAEAWPHAEWAILMVNFGGKTKAEMARRLGIHPSTLSSWMKEHDEYGRLLHPEMYRWD